MYFCGETRTNNITRQELAGRTDQIYPARTDCKPRTHLARLRVLPLSNFLLKLKNSQRCQSPSKFHDEMLLLVNNEVFVVYTSKTIW